MSHLRMSVKAHRRDALVLTLLVAVAGAGGCMVVKPVVGAGAAVAGAAVKTTGAAAGAVADAVVPDEKPAREDAPRGR